MVFFRELRHLLECMKVFIVSKKERGICEFEMDLTNFFVRGGEGGGGKFVCVCNCGVASIVFSGKYGGKEGISLHVFPNGMRHFENTPIYNEFRMAWDFLGVKFCPGIFGVVLFEAQGIFLGFDFCPHSIIPVWLEIWSTPMGCWFNESVAHVSLSDCFTRKTLW